MNNLTSKKTILLFIPIFNCSHYAIDTLNNIKDTIYDKIDQIILIDNGSTDNTVNLIKNYIKKNKDIKIKLIINKKNYSLGGSHKVAFIYALKNNFDFVITIHGDNQGNPQNLYQILNDRIYINYDCLYGSRFKTESKLLNYSKLRILGNYFFNLIFSVILLKKISDIGAGINIYSKNFLQDQSFMKFPNSLMFNPYLHFYSILKKNNVKYFPIDWCESGQLSHVRFFRELYSLLKLIFLITFKRKNFLKKNFSKINKYEYDIIL